jgi:iron(III) transport system ATP-binding protein
MTTLTLQGLSKRYGEVAALDGIDLTVVSGSRTAIVGPSGSGKSTLLRLVAGFEPPDRGRILLGDELLADDHHFVPAHRRGIGVVAQDGALFPHLTVAENIGFGLARAEPGRDGAIAALAEMVDLDARMLPRKPDQLSGGQQQRVALARALARKPRLMLLDEPFSALDAGLRVATRKAVAELLGRAGITTILVTHDQEEALSFADQVAVMRDGRLPQVGSPRELYLKPRDPMIAEFLGDALVLPAEIGAGLARCRLGLVAVARAAPGGAGAIMLRPGQVALRPAGSAAELPGQPVGRGTVTEVDFAGALCTVLVALDGAPGEAPLRLRRPGIEAPTVGTVVEILIAGEAHVFPAEDAAKA